MKPKYTIQAGRKRGINLEYRVKRFLNDDGWFAIRSAGSHGVADIVAIKPGRILFIQCKYNNIINDSELKDLKDKANFYGAEAMVVCAPSHLRFLLYGRWHK